MSWCEYPEFYSESFPKAKKTHQCIECYSPIEIGEEHLYYRGKWDGDFSTGRQHLLCRDICMDIAKNYQGDECLGFGCLLGEWGEMPSASLNRPWSRPLDNTDIKMRSLMAKIQWRRRKHRTMHSISGSWFLRRKWGSNEYKCVAKN